MNGMNVRLPKSHIKLDTAPRLIQSQAALTHSTGLTLAPPVHIGHEHQCNVAHIKVMYCKSHCAASSL